MDSRVTHGLKKIVQQDASWRRARYFAWHGGSPSMVVNDLGAPDMPVAPFFQESCGVKQLQLSNCDS